MSNELDEQEDSVQAKQFSLFDTWTCFNEDSLWKIKILSDKSFFLRLYSPQSREPEERAGALHQYTETPKQAPTEKRAHIVIYLNKRRLNLIFSIFHATNSLEVELFQGRIKANNTTKLSCFR